MRSFDASSSNSALRAASASPMSASTMCNFYDAALNFDATFNVVVFPLDVGKCFARLITHAFREVPH
jgi:hypothetical protein